MKVLLILMLLATLAGCNAPTTVEPQTTVQEEQQSNTVSLSCIKAPLFKEDFATLNLGESAYPVYWGAGPSCVMLAESGYPGFGYPMIIEGIIPIGATSAQLITSWGQYSYTLEECGRCFWENDNLVSKDSGEFLVRWGVSTEFLFLYDLEGNYAKYLLSGGTKIVE